MADFELKINEEGPVDVEAVMKQIRQYIVARNLAKTAGVSGPAPQFDGPLDAAIYEHLYHANMLHNQLTIAPLVVPSRKPLIGPLLNFVRGKFHELTLFYVNQLAQKQSTFNAHVAGVLNGLVREVEELK
jgi:hypothetical protein